MRDATAARSSLPAGWSQRGGRLLAAYRFGDFRRAMGFLTEVALQAEALGHHPDFRVHWDEVQFEVWSHDAGRVTTRDHRLAGAIARIARRHGARTVR